MQVATDSPGYINIAKKISVLCASCRRKSVRRLATAETHSDDVLSK